MYHTNKTISYYINYPIIIPLSYGSSSSHYPIIWWLSHDNMILSHDYPMIIPSPTHHQLFCRASAQSMRRVLSSSSLQRLKRSRDSMSSLWRLESHGVYAGSEAKWRGNTYKTPAKLGWDQDDMLNHLCICVCTIYRYNIHLYDYVITHVHMYTNGMKLIKWVRDHNFGCTLDRELQPSILVGWWF